MKPQVGVGLRAYHQGGRGLGSGSLFSSCPIPITARRNPAHVKRPYTAAIRSAVERLLQARAYG